MAKTKKTKDASIRATKTDALGNESPGPSAITAYRLPTPGAELFRKLESKSNPAGALERTETRAPSAVSVRDIRAEKKASDPVLSKAGESIKRVQLEPQIDDKGKDTAQAEDTLGSYPSADGREISVTRDTTEHLHILELHGTLGVIMFHNYAHTGPGSAALLLSYNDYGWIDMDWKGSKYVFTLNDRGRALLDTFMPGENTHGRSQERLGHKKPESKPRLNRAKPDNEAE